MLTLRTTGAFDREARRAKRRGKDMDKLAAVVERLLREKPLDPRYRDHKLKGEWIGRRECHIEPDWLLIYQVSGSELILERTGTHADLFE